MKEYCQYYKRVWAKVGIMVGACFIGVALDMRFTQFVVKEGFDPLVFWTCFGVGALALLGSLRNLVSPPLILRADGNGLEVGSLTINQPVVHIAWNEVKAINVIEIFVNRHSDNRRKRPELALKIEGDESVRLGDRFDHMSSSERPCPPNIALIGQYYFDQDVLRIQNSLRKVAATHGRTDL